MVCEIVTGKLGKVGIQIRSTPRLYRGRDRQAERCRDTDRQAGLCWDTDRQAGWCRGTDRQGEWCRDKINIDRLGCVVVQIYRPGDLRSVTTITRASLSSSSSVVCGGDPRWGTQAALSSSLTVILTWSGCHFSWCEGGTRVGEPPLGHLLKRCHDHSFSSLFPEHIE